MKCNACGRQFATAASLHQHQAASHGGAVPKPSNRGRGGRRGNRVGGARGPPISLPSVTPRPKVNATNVERGSDILAVVKVSLTKLKDGQVLARFPVSPRAFEGTRLWQVAGLWARWIPMMLTLKVSSTCPSTGGGLYGVAWSADPDENLPSTSVNLARKLGVMPHFREANFWEHVSITVRDPPIQRWLYTDMNQDDSRHGCFVVIIMSPPLSITGDISFTIQLDWQIGFQQPDVDFPSEVSKVYIKADEGYDPFYTTSTSHLNVTDRLTLECNSSGGYSSIVRFSSARSDAVYVPVVAGSIKAYGKAGSDGTYPEVEVKALVRMKERSEPFMWCFAGIAEAQDYIKNGTVGRVMAYYKAGNWCPAGTLLEDKSELSAPQSNKVSLNVRDDQLRRYLAPPGQPSVTNLLSAIADQLHLINERLESMPLGTALDPVKVFVEDPVPLQHAAQVVRARQASSASCSWHNAFRRRDASVGTEDDSVELVDGDDLPLGV